MVARDVLTNVITNELQNVRDQLVRMGVVKPYGVVTRQQGLAFSGEESEFNSRYPFIVQGVSDPFNALAYTKAPAMAAPAVPSWLFGANLIGSGDKTYAFGTTVSSATGVGAFDATKIGVFTTNDALTFLVTGSDTWANIFNGTGFNSDTPSGSGTIAYMNGGFSADFTASASWTHNSSSSPLIAPPDSSAVTYTANAQYRFDFPYSIFFEPTGGVTYTETYTANFGTKTGDSTELHFGGRMGTEMKWMGFTVQPSISGQVFKFASINGGAGGGLGVPGAAAFAPVAAVSDTGLGGRGSAKINVIWTPHFSTYVEGHGMGIAGTKTLGYVATQSMGGQAGLRYTW